MAKKMNIYIEKYKNQNKTEICDKNKSKNIEK